MKDVLAFRVRTFLTACDTLNFTKAAKELCITQPAVSQHIRYLEQEYGAPQDSPSESQKE